MLVRDAVKSEFCKGPVSINLSFILRGAVRRSLELTEFMLVALG